MSIARRLHSPDENCTERCCVEFICWRDATQSPRVMSDRAIVTQRISLQLHPRPQTTSTPMSLSSSAAAAATASPLILTHADARVEQTDRRTDGRTDGVDGNEWELSRDEAHCSVVIHHSAWASILCDGPGPVFRRGPITRSHGSVRVL